MISFYRHLAVTVVASACVACSIVLGAPDYVFVDGKVNCNGSSELIDLQSNADHCGRCNMECISGAACVNGQCRCGAGQGECNNACVDLASDDNCGACETRCLSPQRCIRGVCGCGDGQTLCSGNCVDLKANGSHCGACSKDCPYPATCVDGTCTCPSSSPTRCEDDCVNTKTDSANCGSCDHRCGPPGTTSICSNGTCTTSTTCFATYKDCNSDIVTKGVLGDGCEINVASDRENCGQCGRACPTGQVCADSTCVEKTRFVSCDGACAKDTDCVSPSMYCANTIMGYVCIPTQCQGCFNQSKRCTYTTTTCVFGRCQ